MLVAASGIWAAVIVLTLLFLVPVKRRLAALEPEAWAEEARRDHRMWDSRHRYRIRALVAALVCLVPAMRV